MFIVMMIIIKLARRTNILIGLRIIYEEMNKENETFQIFNSLLFSRLFRMTFSYVPDEFSTIQYNT